MTDAPTTEPAAAPPTPAPFPDLTAAQIASAREHWTGLGHDAFAFDAAATGAPLAASMGGGAQRPDDDAIQVVGASKTPPVTTEQAAAMANALRASGVPEERIQAALEADGIKIEPDTRSDARRELDRAFPMPAPNEYAPTYRGRWEGTEAELVAFDAEARTWLAAVGLPVPIGNDLIERHLDLANRWKGMSEADRTMFKAENRAQFERHFGGPEEVELALAKAEAVIKAAPQAFTDKLALSGILDDWSAVMNLVHHTDRQLLRGRV